MTVVSVLVALLLLGILITVHEFGHYIFARMTGIEANRLLVPLFSVLKFYKLFE